MNSKTIIVNAKFIILNTKIVVNTCNPYHESKIFPGIDLMKLLLTDGLWQQTKVPVGVAAVTVDVPLKPPLLATMKSNNYLLNAPVAMHADRKVRPTLPCSGTV